jgi:DNA-3-methyladenine glycosylase I
LKETVVCLIRYAANRHRFRPPGQCRQAGRNRLKPRCPWALAGPLEAQYHDTEWGVPVHDDRTLFEFLILEGVQAGLSWSTVLKKRPAYRKAFDKFSISKVALYDDSRIQKLLKNTSIIRNKRKIEASVANALAFLAVQAAFGSFDDYLWRFVDGRPTVNAWTAPAQVPAATPESEQLSRDLRQRGFRFVGPVICYALMQAVGLVNDHLVDCFRHAEIVRSYRR